MFPIIRYGDEDSSLIKNESNKNDILESLRKSAKKKKAAKRLLDETLVPGDKEISTTKEIDDNIDTKKVKVEQIKNSSNQLPEKIVNIEKRDLIHSPYKKNQDVESVSRVGTEGNNKYDPFEVLKMRLKAPKGGLNFEMFKVDHKLPEWIENPYWIDIDINNSEDFDLTCFHELVQKNLKEMGIFKLFPVQTSLIPALLYNSKCFMISRPNDICVCSPTGSGKTLAFAIPIINCLLESPINGTRALVVVPTIELAKQVHGVFLTLSKGSNIKSILLGGSQIETEKYLLSKKSKFGFEIFPDVIVTTPGRLAHFLEVPDLLHLNKLRFLVIDEADRILDVIKQSWLQKLRYHLPQSEQSTAENATLQDLINPKRSVQKLLFSATLNTDPQRLKTLNLFQPRLFLAKPATENRSVSLTSQYITPPTLHEHTVICETNMKPLIVMGLLITLKVKKALCFTRTAESTRRLHHLIKEYSKFNILSIPCLEFSSLLTKRERKRTMNDFNSKKECVLVCSDAVARGIDAEDVELVLLYDSPLFIETYIHRAGRASRAGKEGSVYSLINPTEVSRCKKIFRKAGRQLPDECTVDKDTISRLSVDYEKILSNVQNILQDSKT
uniref:ATP-dependent RNA helicase DDX51-like n=1 Tax=Styela clava TaxID=7725 RepID=UPI00193A5ED9|nr:ATP-dependent RNA helicase DDX51-like [Styela clava]